jgi:hypothetical protein
MGETKTYKVDLNIIKIKQLLADIAREQATREFSGTDWLEGIYKRLDEIDEKIIINTPPNRE